MSAADLHPYVTASGILSLLGLPAQAVNDARYLNPCTAAEARRYAHALRRLLGALDGEIVAAALIGEGKTDLLGAEGQEVDSVRKFLDGRIRMRSEPGHLRGRALAVLDAFENEIAPTNEFHHETPYVARALTRYVTGAVLMPFRWLQRKAVTRRAASTARPSGTIQGGDR